MSENMKIILPARQIPVGSIVTRFMGHSEYILKDAIYIHPGKTAPDRKSQEIKAEGESRFLISCDKPDGHINVVDPTSLLIWLVKPQVLCDFIQEHIIGEDTQ